MDSGVQSAHQQSLCPPTAPPPHPMRRACPPSAPACRRRCKTSYDPSANTRLSCRFHPSFFLCRRHDDQKRCLPTLPYPALPYTLLAYDLIHLGSTGTTSSATATLPTPPSSTTAAAPRTPTLPDAPQTCTVPTTTPRASKQPSFLFHSTIRFALLHHRPHLNLHLIYRLLLPPLPIPPM
ncbi:unnamed protein product [Miscanthus lutarioriparius]|uniref:Uncharacterized protein n=1 Tax=Miscanthus lutarioriparius TaxID=422564 RepID=A0A811S2H7_9POAL|nr:unnamed protein product [Miscanthus lutarioriparius]